MGWKSDKREFVEIVFEFDAIREFHELELYCNNQFTRDISTFKEVQVFFSISGQVYGTEPVTHTPLPDQIFESPRNISVKLHRRVAKYLKVQLYFASKWILVSEVSFDSTLARGNYTDDMFVRDDPGLEQQIIQAPEVVVSGEEVEPEKVNTKEPNHESELSLMPIIVGALSTVIVLLAAIIFFIVSRTREKKALSNKQPSTQCSLPSEKVALNPTEPIHYAFFTEGTVSESGSNSGSRSGGSRKIPMFDDNYNNRQASYGSPRTMRSVYSRQDSTSGAAAGCGAGASPGLRRSTPSSTPRLGGHTPRRTRTPQRRIINNPLSESAPLYMEPYHAMRYSPYARCGLTDLAVSKETAILSGNNIN